MAKAFFKVSSGLKDLIGGQLITDKYAAVFELVKNAFDAKATKVVIRFEKLYSTEEAKIIISDNGKGMDHDDIHNKWLWVAYSAKKDGTEDVTDYRDNISIKRQYAGAKGVGRFSCDRLGQILNLYSRKKNDEGQIEHLKIDWREFEKKRKVEFGKIPILRDNQAGNTPEFKYGTILEISKIVEEDWDRVSLLDLKVKLSKLIRPNISNTIKDKRAFKVFLEVPDEIENDEKAKKKYLKDGLGKVYKETVNGEINNFIFEDLDIRTTRIITEVINNGKEIKTILIDRNTPIYTVVEKNPFRYLLSVVVHLYFLNPNAKSIFTKKVGQEPINYGNVFVYKNGFRIYPFGEPRDDSMGIDSRGTQGYARNLQTRNLIGQIEIYQRDDKLIESTSRDAGFIKNIAWKELKEFFFEKCLKRLEKYVVDVAEWGVDDESLKELSEKDIKENLVKFISNISGETSVVSLDYNNQIINLLEVNQEKSANKIIKNFKRIAAESNDKKLLKDASILQSKFEGFKKLNKENVELIGTNEVIIRELEVEKQKNTYLSVRRPLSEDAERLIHTINFNLVEVDERIILLINRISNENLSKNVLLQELTDLKLFTSKSRKLSEIATRANYKYEAEEQWINIPVYLSEYLSIYNDIKNNEDKSSKKVEIKVTSSANLKKYISPLDLAIIADNLIANAIKWKDDNKKTSIQVDMINLSSNRIQILFSDDGKGLVDKFLKTPNAIFELGITETHGSGIGLYSVKESLKELGGTIEFAGNQITELKGACFKILISK